MNCKGGKMRLMAVCLIIITLLGVWGAQQPALARIDANGLTGKNGAFTGPDKIFWITTYLPQAPSPLRPLLTTPIKIAPPKGPKDIQKNWGRASGTSPSTPASPICLSADWKFANNFPPPLSTVTGLPLGGAAQYAGRTAKNIVYTPSILAGIKFGRYLDAYPWLGWEMETSFSRNKIRKDQGRISPAVPGGPTNIFTETDRFTIWALQTNLVARYGFFKDKEVTFGRLQPYVGIGPGLEIIYARFDSAKNFAIETMTGVRYLFTPNVALFCEYKFSYQFAVEYQNFIPARYGNGGTMTFDVPHHRFVIGVSYHFKNLYGN